MFSISLRPDVDFAFTKELLYISFATEEKDTAAFQVVSLATNRADRDISALMKGINQKKVTGTLIPEYNIALMPAKFNKGQLIMAIQEKDKCGASTLVFDLRSFGDQVNMIAFLQDLLRTFSDMKIINAIHDKPVEDWWVLCPEGTELTERFTRFVRETDINV